MPTNFCFEEGNKSRSADLLIKWLSFLCSSFSLLFLLSGFCNAKNRLWPKRTELIVVLSVFFVQIVWTIGAVVDFKQLSPRGDVENKHSDIKSLPWESQLCFCQGVLFQWSCFVMVLNYVWFQYSRYLLICRGVESGIVAGKEIKVMIGIFILASLGTIAPVLLNNVGQEEDFYSCWVNGLFYEAFHFSILAAYLMTIYCAFQTLITLREMEKVVGAEHASVILVQKFKIVNFSFIIIVSYLVIIILLTNYGFTHSTVLCFIENANVPCLGFFTVFSIYGYGSSPIMDLMCRHKNKKSSSPLLQNEENVGAPNQKTQNLRDPLVPPHESDESSRFTFDAF